MKAREATERFAPIMIGVLPLWLAFASTLYVLAKPLSSFDSGRTLVFDSNALWNATTIAVLIALVGWMTAIPLSQRAQTIAPVVAGLSTWLLSSAFFYWIDNMDGRLPCRCEFAARASAILGDGQDLIFLPLVIPALSAISGALFAVVLWLSNRLIKRPCLSGS
ncbi:MAG: hypothetical protein ABSE46_02610 [Terracidiphilus sp.]|jgi:hypothetical protein